MRRVGALMQQAEQCRRWCGEKQDVLEAQRAAHTAAAAAKDAEVEAFKRQKLHDALDRMAWNSGALRLPLQPLVLCSFLEGSSIRLCAPSGAGPCMPRQLEPSVEGAGLRHHKLLAATPRCLGRAMSFQTLLGLSELLRPSPGSSNCACYAVMEKGSKTPNKSRAGREQESQQQERAAGVVGGKENSPSPAAHLGKGSNCKPGTRVLQARSALSAM